MRKILKKVLVIILIILILNNFLINSANAVPDPTPKDPEETWLETIVGTFIGALTFPLRFVALAIGWGINALTAGVAYMEGSDDPSVSMFVLTPFDILFNKVRIVGIDFFDVSGLQPNSVTYRIRMSIAGWYYVFRLLAIAILLVILIYVGIRMAISTIATDKAMYKKMLVDWVCSLALIFIIQYIVVFTVTVNDAFIKAISMSVNSKAISDTYTVIRDLAFTIAKMDSIPATIIYCMLVWQTLSLLISYFNRMLKLAFLVIMSPLITLTYSIDKMGDGKAQALGAWLKEFVYTILRQPFHCVIYMVFIDTAFRLLSDNGKTLNENTLPAAIVSIMCITFIKTAEGIVMKIFNFKDDGTGSVGTGMAVASMALGSAKNIGSAARSTVNGVRNFAGHAAGATDKLRGAANKVKGVASNATRSAAVGAVMLATTKRKDESGNKVSLSDRKAEARKKVEASAEKRATKKAEKYTAKTAKKEFKQRVKDLKAANKTMSNSEAKKEARKEMLKDAEKKKKKEIDRQAEKLKRERGLSDAEAQAKAKLMVAKKAHKDNKPIARARGRINSIKKTLAQSDVLRTVGNVAKGYMSAGLGVVVGSGMAGTGSNAITSIMGGAAMYKGTREFFSSSSSTIAEGIDDNYKALGCRTAEEAAEKTAEIMQKFSNADLAAEELNKIMDDIENALQHLGVDGKIKTRIKNTIQNGIKANPGKTQDVINYALSNLETKTESGAEIKVTGHENGGELRQAVQRLADFTNESEIYRGVQNAGELGLEPDTIIAQALENFDNNEPPIEEITEHTTEQIENTEVEETEETYIESVESVDEDLAGLSDSELAEYEAMLEAKIEEIKNENEKYSDEEKAKILEELRRRQVDVMSKTLADVERQSSEIEREMVKKYEEELQKELEKAIDERKQLGSKNDEESSGKISLLTAQIERMEETQQKLSAKATYMKIDLIDESTTAE